jgi:hypothetical protein
MARRETGEKFRTYHSVETRKFAIDGQQTIGEDRVTGVFRWLRHRHDHESGGLRATGYQSSTSRTSWKVVESVASPALGNIYIQVLQQAGIPVQVQQWGAGAGAMGGALTGVRILTPEDRFDEAREVLDAGTAGSEVTHE